MIKQEKEENVLCVHRAFVQSLGLDQGFNATPHEQFKNLIRPDRAVYLPSSECEVDERYLQVLPYILYAHRGDVLAYRRLKKSGERRLLGNHSIGFGGHVNDRDAGFEAAVDREAREELRFPIGRPSIEYRGLVLDDSNPVGRVHLGVVHVAHIPMSAFEAVSNEPEKIGIIGFFHPAHLQDFLEDEKKWPFENWSRMCIESLDVIL